MTDRIQIWISKSILQMAVNAMLEVAAHRRKLFVKNDDGYNEYEDQNGLDAVRKLESMAKDIEDVINYQPERATEDEQITAIKELIKELQSDGAASTYHHSSHADTLRSQIRHIRQQRKAAFDAWGSLVDDQRVNMRAVRLMVERALQCDTHRRKNSTLYVLLDSTDNMLVNLANINSDEPEYYDYWDERKSSWEFRRLVSENRRLEHRVKDLEQHLRDREMETEHE